ncbi:MAG: MBL fold metallo-hydrolase [Paraburkholderia sp.]|nr:MAG: MBL fold metallo-hydrolase [Paraburkholderia sp.]
MDPKVAPFFDPVTATISYVVHAGEDSACAVIDPVLDYDAKSGRTRTTSADQIVDFVSTHRLRVEWLLETHAHADHLSASDYLKSVLGGKTAIGERIRAVQETFVRLFNLGSAVAVDGSQFDHLFVPDETFSIGPLHARALHVPGHTAADMAYQIGDCVFVGDTLFMPDAGSARCDFPGGNAGALYRSARKLLALPPATRLFMCHDYPPQTREPRWVTTVAEQRSSNIHLHDGISESEFVAIRTDRDSTLDTPVLILPAIQVNIRGGALPSPEGNGVSYLKIPLNVL